MYVTDDVVNLREATGQMELTSELKDLLEQEPFDEAALEKIREVVFASENNLHNFNSLVNQQMQSASPKQAAEALKVGLSLCVLNRYEDAVRLARRGSGFGEKWLYLGRAQRVVRDYPAAMKSFDKARAAGVSAAVVAVEQARTQLAASSLEKADALLNGVAEDDREALWHVARASLLEAQGNRREAVNTYEHALDYDEDNQEAMFRLAYLADLAGDDDQALAYYESFMEGGPAHANALLNLAVLYEDREEYDKAEDCISKVLAIWPDHERARLFLKDIEAGQDMVIDEDIERFQEKRSALFDVPIADFELSVRARNCLQSMGINTLGDLLRVTEEQLLAYKNFGETSLDEIKNLLDSKNLRLGQALEEERKVRQQEILKQVQGDPAVLVKPVGELELSVRARKALQRLNIQTIGELAARSESELLGVKNFGQTSLNEIRQRLGEYGLTLRRT